MQAPPKGRAGRRKLAAVLCAVMLSGPVLVLSALAFGHDARSAEAARELTHRADGFAGAAGCADCHPDQHASWNRTFHSTMTQRASPETVLGHFDGERVEYQGESARVFERGGEFFMEVPDTAAPRGRRTARVALTVGSRRYQQYFERVAREEGVSYERLPLLWHVDEQRWMHLNTVFLEPDDARWDAHRAVWNANCIFCHNTAPRPGGIRVPAGGGPLDAIFDSSAADLGIACEACHGPGAAHAARHRAPLERYATRLAGGAAGANADDIVNPERLGQRESIAVCGQCHGQRLPKDIALMGTWMTSGPTFRPGDALEEHVELVTRELPSPVPNEPELFRDRFWADGTARLTAYEAQGTLASPCMADAGFTCIACHSMHGGDPRGMIEPELRTNAACTGCHAEIGADVAAHTGHKPDGPGSACYDCHMPRIAYGVIEIHRSHRIESPDPARDAEAGRPDACTLCHLDQSPAWAAREMERMFGRPFEKPRSRPSGASVELPEATASLLAGDAVERAVAAAALGRAAESGAIAPRERAFLFSLLAVSLGDAYPSVRRIAQRGLLELDRVHGLGLGEWLAAFDPMNAGGDAAGRERLVLELLELIAAAAPARFDPPKPGELLGPDFRIERAELQRLLDLQTSRPIAIGE